MNVVVAGGTGLLGAEITKALLDAGHTVTVASRSKPKREPLDPRASWVGIDVTDPATLGPALAGAEAVVDAVQFPNSPIENPKKGFTFERIDFGGTKNLIDAARAAGVRHFILIGGVGADEEGQYHWMRFKWQEEQHLKASGLNYTIIRPSWIYGPRDVSLNRFMNFAKFLPFIPVIGNGKTRINPLFVGDLAAHVAATPGNERAMNQTFEIGGPAVLTMDEVIRTALRVKGKKRFLLHSPKPLMKLVASVIQHAPGRPLTPGAIDFITTDGVADTAALQEVYGLKLRSLEEGLRTYLAP